MKALYVLWVLMQNISTGEIEYKYPIGSPVSAEQCSIAMSQYGITPVRGRWAVVPICERVVIGTIEA